jgi:hypothetical protein
VIYGVRVVGESALRWIDTELELEPGAMIERDGLIAQVVVTTAQLGESRSNVIAEPAAVSVVGSSSSTIDSVSSRELDRILGQLPPLGSDWTSREVTGTVVSVDFKRQSFFVRSADTSDVVTVPFPNTNEGN